MTGHTNSVLITYGFLWAVRNVYLIYKKSDPKGATGTEQKSSYSGGVVRWPVHILALDSDRSWQELFIL